MNHSLLLLKLYHYGGVTGHVSKQTEGFLGNRQQAVVVEGTKSYYVSVWSGVPQGSALRTSLFLFYINNLPIQVTSLTWLFANDAAINRLVIMSVLDYDQLQQAIQQHEQWKQSWNMIFHTGKFPNFLLSQRKKNTESDLGNHNLHRHALRKVIKYLAITIQQDLN